MRSNVIPRICRRGIRAFLPIPTRSSKAFGQTPPQQAAEEDRTGYEVSFFMWLDVCCVVA
jgi:hypothetical protein